MRCRNELQVEDNFRKRIEKRFVKLKIRISIPESFRLFVSHEKLNFLRKGQSNRLDRCCLQWHWKLSIFATRCWRHSNFLSLYKATVGVTVISSELLFGFSSFKVCQLFRENDKFDGTSKKFGLSLASRENHEHIRRKQPICESLAKVQTSNSV